LSYLETGESRWPERTLYFQWHRGDAPELYRDCAARNDRWKLVMHLDKSGQPVSELYDMSADPGEARDVAADNPEITRRLRQGYEAWLKDVSSTRGYDPPRIHLGSRFENPTTLTRQDWRGPNASWGAEALGYWEVQVESAASYDVTLVFPSTLLDGEAHFRLGSTAVSLPLRKGSNGICFEKLRLKPGPGRLEAWLELPGKSLGVHYVDVKRL
jgi:hypothetical protein